MKNQIKIENRKAFHDYSVIETIQAGIELLGSEVKSIRNGNVSLRDSYGRFENNQLYLNGMHIAKYPGSFESINPLRKRRLLLHRSQIQRWRRRVEEKGLTIVPLSLYTNEKGIIKLDIALVRGKKFFDKRRDIKEKEVKRHIERHKRYSGAK
ncbi:MAG: SsrA-binding protein [Candidatus Omnitrophica bacterium]|nr:SsrA-binding protein [Candidatus Omnitrophota bacterium]MCM8828428.1 SsrA-binding protein [Candidatus Omnitrophota bacterium]